MKNPKILVLDEATRFTFILYYIIFILYFLSNINIINILSALDAKSEKKVQKALNDCLFGDKGKFFYFHSN